MRFLITANLVALASAAAIEPIESRSYNPCSGLTSSALCCGTSVDGVLELDCTPPSVNPDSGSAFQASCAAVGKSPGCCLLGLAGLALVCNPPIGA
ncbi:fungal hydrophobin domain-containing protein [Cordyceps javanica]|uniref:Fungal hydrophobin domain-containing protein n=1 Tax=Cordyceps javanica TaxID=43265 RepID=A0A545VHV4_9HYPO|nr:fungal hydrophobin domain-containing protein [Cordyceps javanica]TQW12458.1 fungal hydrophobin domain-containing protein [Cordyceps javanica]